MSTKPYNTLSLVKEPSEAQKDLERIEGNIFKLENAKAGLLVLATDASIEDKSVSSAIHAFHDLMEFALNDVRATLFK